jgi:formylglycine-generating enzyme required for sulfatase activity
LDFAFIPPGTFRMGSAVIMGRFNRDEIPHEVTLTRAFAMSIHEVTQGDFVDLLGAIPSEFECGLNCPVETVTFTTALAYTNALSESKGLPACYSLSGCVSEASTGDLDCSDIGVNAPEGNPYLCEGYRLPTEAEWEYAVRAGTETDFYSGDMTEPRCNPVDSVLDQVGFFCGNSATRPHIAMLKAPNEFGLYDMHGNVAEWVWDLYGTYDEEALIDPFGPDLGEERVIRGGSWEDDAQDCRSAMRLSTIQADRAANIGFRVVISID